MLKPILFFCCILVSICSAAQTASRFDVIITEIMADPSPQVGLPNAEFIEVKNVSTVAWNLNGWKLSDATSTATINSSIILQPDSFLILCSNSNVVSFSAYGKTLGITSFPSLDNDGDQITLRSNQGKVVHTIAYTSDWYQNAVKKDGGWTLEMIDTHNPCTGMKNWKASVDPNGGTPGKKNSVDGVNDDSTPPQLIRTYSIDSTTVVAVFDEPLDSASGATIPNYAFLPGISIASVTPVSPLFNQVIIKLNVSLLRRTVYDLSVTNVKDCRGNTIATINTTKAGLAEEASPMDIVVNEVLFNPKPNAYDYVECYNRSRKVLDAGKLFIANRNGSNAISSLKKLSETPFYIFPGEYIVATEDASSLQQTYFVQSPDHILSLSSLPSFPDDKGTIVLTNSQGAIVDELSYKDDWHFALINEKEGISLERIDPDDSSQKQSNWHSAASTAGYGTPTYKNSQYKRTDAVNAIISVLPKIFSPDNDGRDDIATISYQVERSGYVANISIFDANGRLVRYFVKNALLGLKGSWNWDGLDEKAQKLPIGTYIIYTEIFNLDGKKKQFKNTIVLARQLN